ncbi:cysteine--tRNA ligase [Candidatus Woesearchaeota archaeon]|jgi:cysteinyl-tRNA synthetase|nr:cysteine--tRNA ligase [Candidatus Woesearchaeota archaeon]MBT5396729.1 cysteine--tRNA ligase [Candidatus Woesearchaeota archaeon]MBT5924695.1 cysteine--tRNA ligase [Candidatus Woesearchaeota archaeon]MBT6367484.1 cysteine--tRNA ligase [Candidatus Woesearchaeota archaeon]MBT7762983.1 cysteine--tRNA ligase [Candidatus Woesearchaeota archaeon]
MNKLTLYNTLARKKETFVPLKKGSVGMYCCGPTVYNYAHVGNLRSYIFEDVLRRVLEFNKFKVKHVTNITDVGHLTSDADVGEDKMLKGAKREKKTVWQIAEFYTKAFKDDIIKLNIKNPNTWSKATDHIKEQITLIQILEKKGFTYQAGGNVYFDTSSVKDYGKLAKLDLKADTKERVEEDKNKKNKHDFVLWFTKSKFQDQGMKWKSPYGTGYPGWHIECSAMSMKYLGKQFDIHCGGIDHIPVHHTNEIVQSESATGKKPWVKYWLHNEFLVLRKGEKMAKSGDNFITLQTLEEKEFHPLDYRYFCLGTHYRKPLMFSWDALESAQNARTRLFDRVLEIKSTGGKVLPKYGKKFIQEINNDLNTPNALAIVWDLFKDKKLKSNDMYTTLLLFDRVLGLGLKNITKDKIPQNVTKLAKERLNARQDKDWKNSDKLRDEINKLGYDIEDSAEGYTIKKK